MKHKSIGGKFIPNNQIIGQKGVNLIEAAVLEMGYAWKPTTATTDAGIDGDIEIRDPKTGEATNYIIRVQSKATEGDLESETETSFVFRVKERDLAYWLRGNAPVILIVAKLATKELFWMPVKEYFNTAEKRATKKVHFDKRRSRFTKEAAKAIANLSIPADDGIYMNPPPKQEILTTNLLEVTHSPEMLFIAQTQHKTIKDVELVFEELGEKPGRLWFVKEGKIFSFHDLKKEPWTKVINQSTLTTFKTTEWANSSDLDKKNEFLRLMYQALRTFTARKDMGTFVQDGRLNVYYFRPNARRNRETDTDEAIERDETWQGQKENTRRVVERYYSKKDPAKLLYYRHHAFTGKFRRFGMKWYLEITPTYHYTKDGRTESPYRQENLSGMKRQEGHAAVSNNVRFLGYYLAYHDLLRREYPFLRFGKLLEAQIDAGIHEGDWNNRMDEDEVQSVPSDSNAQSQTQMALA